METRIRYGEFLNATRWGQRAISLDALAAQAAASPQRARLRLIDLHRLLTPYVGVRFFEQLRAVLPVTLFLALFQVVALRAAVSEAALVATGVGLVILGLMLFMEGLKHGLMPFSENIGYLMPGRSRTAAILAVGLLLGAAATFAEPAIGALKAAGAATDPRRAPLLYRLLNEHSTALVLAVAGSVGVAVLVSLLRFMHGWTLKRLVFLTALPCLGLTAWMMTEPLYAPVVGLAWDSGAITTGPVTVPLVLALGVGVSAAAGEDDNPLGGFGIVTLASLLPPLGVMLTALWVAHTPAAAAAAAEAAGAAGGYTPWPDVLLAVRAILPLVLILWAVQRLLLKERLQQPGLIAYGVVLCLIGMALFNIGLSLGLGPLGVQSGGLLSRAFTADGHGAALYSYETGLVVALSFALVLGFGATLAEPALNALGITVENLTDGAFRRRLLVHAVAAGVGLGTALGVAKVIFGWPLGPLLLGGYALALGLTVFASEEFVNLAWDSAGVTTGPVTVPLVLAMGVGLAQVMHAADGFGILALASAGPVISVLVVGQWIGWRTRRHAQAKV